jgi:class 3 adenylate cyclase
MNTEFDLDSDNYTEQDFGGGSTLPVIGYLVFGLLTFWIYTVWNFHATLAAHFRLRRIYFTDKLKNIKPSKSDSEAMEVIFAKGFSSPVSIKYTCTTLYALSLLMLSANLVLKWQYTQGQFDESIFYEITYGLLGLGSIIFCVSTVIFLLWVNNKTRDHEYHELIFAKYINDQKGIKMVRPSPNFTKRWEKNQGMIALFLILSIPLIFSPVIFVRNFNAILESGDLSSIKMTILIGYTSIFACAAIFHFCGTKIMTDMFNGHLVVEMENQQVLQQKSSSQVEEPTTDSPTKASSPKRALAAVMMTDIAGFSKSMELDEEKTYEKLLTHKKIVREEVISNHGEVIDNVGDAFFIRFDSAVDAVTVALNIQNRFSKHNKDKDESEQIWIRIGVHLGDILFMENDVFGNGVNIAARIEPMAEPGGICVSGDVYNVVKKSIDLKAVSLGRKEMKNISDAPEVFRILIEDYF